MKKIKFLITFVLAAAILSCSDDDSGNLDGINNADAPANVSALFTITQDNTGLVTIAPNGDGANSFEIHFGDGSTEPALVNTGQMATHTYAEGNYQVKIIGVGLNGKTTEYSHNLEVSFTAPQNLVLDVTPVPGNSMAINVTATADNEAFFEVTYGEDPGQAPVQFNEGQTVTHAYTTPGTYTVTVTAFSGGAASTTDTQTVTVTNPLLLPIDFENATLNYSFMDFDGAASSVVDNPNATGNTSAKVAKVVKNVGSQTWAGTVITLDQTIDFSTLNQFQMKVLPPMAGATVILKVENLTSGAIFHEAQTTTTAANQWQTLNFDFSGVNVSQQYSKIVLFFNFGVNGSGETFYYDDIIQVPGAESYTLPINFEFASVNYLIDEFEGAYGDKVPNPHPTGINTSANVGQCVKTVGAQTYAGLVMALDAPVNFSSNQKIKMKVWSPGAGKIVLLKFENLTNSAINIERQATTTVANQWEELTFDFTGVNNASNFQKIVLFFDFNVPGNGATYYFDDIQQFN